jgi:hypothetical protein
MTSTIFDTFPTHEFFESANKFNAISSIPVCGPARGALLTGLRPDTTKIYNFETYLHQDNIFSYFKDLGYDTFVTGKVFHTLPYDKNIQFEYGNGFLSGPRVCLNTDNSGCKGNNFYCTVPQSEDLCSIQSVTNFFKSRINNQKNWIAGVGFHRPHLLLTLTSKNSQLCKRYINDLNYEVPIIYENNTPIKFQYSLSNLEHLDLGYLKVPINGIFTSIINKNRHYPSDLFVPKYNPTIKQIRQAYCDSSTETINYFLQIVDSLYSILPNSRNDTDIVFVADHGFQIGERKILGKNTLYPEATNIPLFFKIAGEFNKRAIQQNYYSSIDIFPTLVQFHVKSNLRITKFDGVSLFGSTIPIPISQYPRCQDIQSIQTNDCMTGTNSCTILGRPAITYMGYLTIQQINGITYRFSEWFKFNEIRTCGWPSWSGIPQNFIGNLGQWPVWNLQQNSYTDFSKSFHRELYTIDTNTQLVNSANLANSIDIKIINQLEQIIKNNV